MGPIEPGMGPMMPGLPGMAPNACNCIFLSFSAATGRLRHFIIRSAMGPSIEGVNVLLPLRYCNVTTSGTALAIPRSRGAFYATSAPIGPYLRVSLAFMPSLHSALNLSAGQSFCFFSQCIPASFSCASRHGARCGHHPTLLAAVPSPAPAPPGGVASGGGAAAQYRA